MELHVPMNIQRLLKTFEILCPVGSNEDAEDCARDFFQTIPLSVSFFL